jgi:hypothetical protein
MLTFILLVMTVRINGDYLIRFCRHRIVTSSNLVSEGPHCDTNAFKYVNEK